MPHTSVTKYVPADILLDHKGIKVYYLYYLNSVDEGSFDFKYTLREDEYDFQFDVRELANCKDITSYDRSYHRKVVMEALDQGLLNQLIDKADLHPVYLYEWPERLTLQDLKRWQLEELITQYDTYIHEYIQHGGALMDVYSFYSKKFISNLKEELK